MYVAGGDWSAPVCSWTDPCPSLYSAIEKIAPKLTPRTSVHFVSCMAINAQPSLGCLLPILGSEYAVWSADDRCEDWSVDGYIGDECSWC